MSRRLTCPQCGDELRGQVDTRGRSRCPAHGLVPPRREPQLPDDEVLGAVARRAQVPLWLPWPLPAGWAVTGVRWAGTDDEGPVATALALAGPNPLAIDAEDPPVADVVVVAEQPGVGMAAHLAGLGELDAGGRIGNAAPDVHLAVQGHATPMWSFGLDDRGAPDPPSRSDGGPAAGAAFVGEALGVWLWLLAWPAAAAGLMLSELELIDLRSPQHHLVVPFGPLSPRLG